MRKALSLVLVLALVLGSFSMAFAATPAGLSDIAGNANAEAIQVVHDLGIVTGNPDGTYLPAKAVNRAEFAALITRALAVPDSALAGYTATKFKDTAGYDWAVKYLAFCETKGIMLGDGQGNAMPGRTISVNEAMTMALRAIGYTSNSDALVGAWPANYVTMAQNEGLYDDVAAALTVDKANAAQIIYNLLTVQKVKVNSEGTTTNATGNLLTTGLGCATTPNYTIDGGDYAIANINISKYMGAYGTLYTKDGDIVAFEPTSTALYGKMDGTKFEAADGIDYTLPTGFVSGTAIMNAAVTPVTDELADMLAASDANKVTLNVKVSGKTIEQVYTIVGWQATKAKMIAASDVKDIADNSKLLGSSFVEDNNGVIDTNQFELVGAAKLSDLAKDDVVYVYADNGTIRKVAVGTAVVTGKVAEQSSTAIYINGVKYEKANLEVATTVAEDLPTLDQSVELYLDAYGKVYASEATGGTVDKYAVVQAFTSQGAMDNAKAKFYTADDTSKILNFVDNADITADVATNLIAAGDLVGYALNNEGKINTINTDDVAVDVSASASALQSAKVLKVAGNYYDIKSDVVVYTYSTTSTAFSGTYDLSSIAKVEIGTFGEDIKFILDDGDVAALLVHTSDANGTSDDVYGVINAVSDVLDGTTTVNKLVGFIGGTAYTKNTATDLNATKLGGLQKFELDATGKVKTITDFAEIATNGDFQIATSGISSDNTVLTASGSAVKMTVASDAVVYKAVVKDGAVDSYEVASLSDLDDGDYVALYDTKDTPNGIANVVIFSTVDLVPAE